MNTPAAIAPDLLSQQIALELCDLSRTYKLKPQFLPDSHPLQQIL